jgi:TatD DNase family protein
MVTMIIDTHAHLMFDQFKGKEIDVLKKAAGVGVGRIINVGCSKDASRQAYEMLAKYDGKSGVSLYASLGLHPYDVLDLSDDLLSEWEGWIKKEKRIVAIGEIGLDYFKAQVSKDKQKEAFIKQLEFAERVGLPVIIHNREADEDTFEILLKYPKIKAVFHCYGSDLPFARKLWDHGYFTSFTGVITYPNAKNLHEVVRECPDWTVIVETDCPFLAPQRVRGSVNEPSYVVDVLKEIAKIKGRDFADIEELQERNVKGFYGV